ncbi:hypothetical protein MMC26_006194 [Xylographa opegraphella]|nr:hypothetical protein [Xylographa opegraphella]
MGRELQKKKNRSSIPKVKHKPKSKRLHVLGNATVAANWDQALTLSQNYRQLGLTSKVNARTGGTERSSSQIENNPHSTIQAKDRLSVVSKLPTSIAPSEARIERDPLTGVILRVFHSNTTLPNPLDDPLNEVLEVYDDDKPPVHRSGGIIPELEEEALMEAKKRPRQQSKREEDWISNLVMNYGEDFGSMTRDRKLNPYQQSEGDLRRRSMPSVTESNLFIIARLQIVDLECPITGAFGMSAFKHDVPVPSGTRYTADSEGSPNIEELLFIFYILVNSMVDNADKEKADKLAAAKRRFEQLKKQKEKTKKVTEKAAEKNDEDGELLPDDASKNSTLVAAVASSRDVSGTVESTTTSDGGGVPEEIDAVTDPETSSKPSHHRQPSLSLQSRMRSSSFRRTSIPQTPLSPTTNGSKQLGLPALSPDGDAVTEIYRKQAFRLDELEKENRKLLKEVEAAESRWRETEEELEELRENSGQVAALKDRAEKADAKTDEVNKLRFEVTSLQRQNSHLQSLTSKVPRHASSPPQASKPTDLLAQLNSKSSTIESMEMEISNLRTELERHSSISDSHAEQVTALEEKLDRAERAAGAAQRELLDARRNLDRASEKAVKEGSERTSTETRIKALTREADESKKNAGESWKRVDTLEKKLAALTNLHKESDSRRQNGDRERERAEKEVRELSKKMVGIETENLRLKEERDRLKKKSVGNGDADEGLDELEDMERTRLEARVRELEGEVFDLRSGVWKEKKEEIQGGDEGIPRSPGGDFDEVDLSGPMGLTRRQSPRPGIGQGFANVLSNGFSAFTGGVERPSAHLVADDDGFDEDAFRQAQEEEARQRVDRVKEVKRRLKDWEGWRMDLVDTRVGGGGAGDIFDV